MGKLYKILLILRSESNGFEGTYWQDYELKFGKVMGKVTTFVRLSITMSLWQTYPSTYLSSHT